MRAGIALGANLGDRLRCLTTARARIFALEGVRPPLLSSSLYETDPIDCEFGAAKFFNAVIELDYGGTSLELLHGLQRIEAELGRPAGHERNRSRTIDLDLLYHGEHEVEQAGFILPHPRLNLRAFVLQPLAEIRPELIVPNEKRTVRQIADDLAPAPSVVRLAMQW